jgi:hypothetical protein
MPARRNKEDQRLESDVSPRGLSICDRATRRVVAALVFTQHTVRKSAVFRQAARAAPGRMRLHAEEGDGDPMLAAVHMSVLFPLGRRTRQDPILAPFSGPSSWPASANESKHDTNRPALDNPGDRAQGLPHCQNYREAFMPLHRVSGHPPENLGVSRSLLAVGPSRSQVQGPQCA